MTTPPLSSPPKPDKQQEPIKESIAQRLTRMRDMSLALHEEIAALQRIEKALNDSLGRIERHSSLMSMETSLIDQLLRRERHPTPVKAIPTNQLADKVEEDLAQLTASFANTKDAPSIDMAKAPVAFPLPKR